MRHQEGVSRPATPSPPRLPAPLTLGSGGAASHDAAHAQALRRQELRPQALVAAGGGDPPRRTSANPLRRTAGVSCQDRLEGRHHLRVLAPDARLPRTALGPALRRDCKGFPRATSIPGMTGCFRHVAGGLRWSRRSSAATPLRRHRGQQGQVHLGLSTAQRHWPLWRNTWVYPVTRRPAFRLDHH